MPLTDKTIRNLKPADAPFKKFDGEGMYVLVHPDGGKYWRLKYRFAGKEKVLALGVYPAISLAEARQRRGHAKATLYGGRDPGNERFEQKRLAKMSASNTFESIAREWWEAQRDGWSKAHTNAVLSRLEKELFPKLGSRPIVEIEPPEVLDAIRAIERRGALEWASKTLIAAGQVFRYAVSSGRAKSDPTRDLRGALKSREVSHYARLKEEELPEFLGKLDVYDRPGPAPQGYGGKKVTQIAITLLMLTWVRTGELRGARWPEFNFDKGEWRIPAERMKGGIEHVVPLPSQAIAALEELRAITGKRDHLFPNEHDPRAPMSENTIIYALYRMGYRGRATGHGFRGTASTVMNEQGWNKDWIERQLAHVEKDKVRSAYNFAEYLPERRKMLQAWADYLAGIRAGANVSPIKRAAVAA